MGAMSDSTHPTPPSGLRRREVITGGAAGLGALVLGTRAVAAARATRRSRARRHRERPRHAAGAPPHLSCERPPAGRSRAPTSRSGTPLPMASTQASTAPRGPATTLARPGRHLARERHDLPRRRCALDAAHPSSQRRSERLRRAAGARREDLTRTPAGCSVGRGHGPDRGMQGPGARRRDGRVRADARGAGHPADRGRAGHRQDDALARGRGRRTRARADRAGGAPGAGGGTALVRGARRPARAGPRRRARRSSAPAAARDRGGSPGRRSGRRAARPARDRGRVARDAAEPGVQRDGVVVAVDDVQWLDADSERVLAFALRRLTDEPLLALRGARAAPSRRCRSGSARARGVDRAHPPRAARPDRPARAARQGARTGAGARRCCCGCTPPRAATRCTRSRSVARSPSREETSRRGRRCPVSETLQGVLDARLAGVSPAAREALAATAALAQPTRAIVAAVSERGPRRGRSPPGCSRATASALRLVTPAVRLGGVSAARPVRRSAALHRRLTALVEEPEERAAHLALAAEGPDPEAAEAVAAAARARRRPAARAGTALQRAEHALRLWPREPARFSLEASPSRSRRGTPRARPAAARRGARGRRRARARGRHSSGSRCSRPTTAACPRHATSRGARSQRRSTTPRYSSSSTAGWRSRTC